MKKLITFATAASLLMGSMTLPVYGVTFADIDTVTWSGFKPFLNQAAELGLMSGYDENGKKYCKPRNNVTYTEAVQLMYSIMRAYSGQAVSDATVTKWKPIISAYDIDTWVFNCAAYGLEQGILTTADLEKMSGNKRQATREEVAVIFGKALDTISGYDTKSNASLSYADKSSVSTAALPYVELLNRAELMVGDTDNKFNAQAKITRAEMAVLSVKTYTKLTDEEAAADTATTVSGTITTSMVMQNGDLFISVKAADGTNLSLFGTKGAVTAKYDGDSISFYDIGSGDAVKVSYTGTTLTAITITESQALGKTTKVTGELEKITDSKVVVLDDSDEQEYRLDDDVKVTLDGKSSTISKLKSAFEDAKYDVTLTLDKDEYVLKIEAVINENNPTEGYIDDLDEDEITIKAGSKTYTYQLAKDLEIEYDGKTVRFSKLEDEYDDYNYIVSLKLNDDREVEEIIIESMEDEYNGTLTFINSNRIEIEAGGETHKYDLDDDVTVKIDGKKSSVSALRSELSDDKNFRVSLELNRSDEVTEILATTKYGSNNEGSLEDIDEDEITISVDDKEYTYDIARDVEVTINGKDRDLEDLTDNLGDYSFTVKLGFDSDGDVCEIEATLTEVAEGELKDLIPAEDYIRVVAAGLNVDLELADAVEATLGGKDITLDKLNSELDYAFGSSRIYVELEYNKKGQVEEITAYWEDVFGELQAVDTDEDEITVLADSKKKTYVLSGSAEFIYKLGANVDEDDYDKLSRYDDDIEGLEDFFNDCDKAKDDCMVALTLNSRGDVVRIKVTAQ